MDFEKLEEDHLRRQNRKTRKMAYRHDIKVRDMDEVRVATVEGMIVRVLARREGQEIDTTGFKPLQVYPTVNTEDKVKVAVKPGTFGGIVPTMRGTPIDEAPESDSIYRQITKMWIEATWDLEGQRPESAKIDGGSEIPKNTETKSYTQLASLEWHDPPGGLKQINNFLQGSQAAGILGDAKSMYLSPI